MKANPPLGCPFHVPKAEASPGSSSTDVREVRKTASAVPVSSTPVEQPKTQRTESCPAIRTDSRETSSETESLGYIPKHQIWAIDKTQRDILKRTWSEITKSQGDHLVNLFE